MSDEKKTQTSTQPGIDKSTLEAAIKAVAEQIVPAAVVAAISASKQGQPQAASPSRPQPPNRERCSACGQAKSGCEGKHTMLVVYPQRYPEHGEFFQGAKINGVRYLSNNENHEILVPTLAVDTIRNLVRAFEQNEQEQRVGRKAERRSGSVSPYGSNFNPALKAWR